MPEARLTPKGQKILLDNIAKSNLVIVQVNRVVGAVMTCCWCIPVSRNEGVLCPACSAPVLDIEGRRVKTAPSAKLSFMAHRETIDKSVAMLRFALAQTLHILPSDIDLTVDFD